MQIGARIATAALLAAAAVAQDRAPRPPNILMIVADDLGQSSLGSYGCPLDGITPNIDRLAAEGIRFARAHVTIAQCQPSRSVWMTGRYPHRSGALGFDPIAEDVPTLTEQLRGAGYQNAIFCKVKHLTPRPKLAWNHVVQGRKMSGGREPIRYYRQLTKFFADREADAPFFVMANSSDPHRPFAKPPTFDADNVPVPSFLPDLPEVRAEIASYYTSVARLDRTVGEILRALDDAGLTDDTVVLFTSDHGMPMPFAKMSCYPAGTRTPLIVRWPGVVAPGAVDDAHFVSGIDLMPTLLEIAGAAPVADIDGRSFGELLTGGTQEERDAVVTVFHKSKADTPYPTRCIQVGRYGYIFNGWHGVREMAGETTANATFEAMAEAAANDEAIAARVEMLRDRVPEELYDFDADPHARHNLIAAGEHAQTAAELRQRLLAFMKSVDDPLLARFARHVER